MEGVVMETGGHALKLTSSLSQKSLTGCDITDRIAEIYLDSDDSTKDTIELISSLDFFRYENIDGS